MYAIFEDGSRQYRVGPGDRVSIDYREAEPGTRVELNRVLLYSNGTDLRIGQPVVEGVRVLGDVIDHPSTKLYIQHFRKRKNVRRLRGHRQFMTQLKITHILLPGEAVPPPTEAKKEEKPAEGTPTTTPAPTTEAKKEETPAKT
jgi:large subunit ribosomal protein L21